MKRKNKIETFLSNYIHKMKQNTKIILQWTVIISLILPHVAYSFYRIITNNDNMITNNDNTNDDKIDKSDIIKKD